MDEASRDQARREVLAVWPQFEQFGFDDFVEVNRIREKMGPSTARDLGKLLARDSAGLPDGYALDMSSVLHQMQLMMKIHRLRAAGLDLNLQVYLTSPVLHQISDDPAMTRWIECAIDTALAAMEIEVKTARNLHWKIAARCLLPFMGTKDPSKKKPPRPAG